MKKGLMIGALSLALLAAAVAGVAGGHAMHAQTQLVAVQTAVLRQGSSGGEVKEVQRRLKNWGYYSGAVDGIFGSATLGAVSVIQSLLGLPATGAIGPLTWEGMAQLARDVLAGAQTSEGQYPGYAVGEGAAI